MAMAKRVAYLGPPGTFTEEAALAHDPAAQRLPFPTIPAVASAVEAGMAEEGIVPIENSIEGPVTDTLDLLIHESRLAIRKELVLPINHCLLAKPGTSVDTVQAVFSHPQALGQCRRFIERCFGKAQVVAALSTVAAVEEMKAFPGSAVAIAPQRAADLYNVEVLARGVQDHTSNATRFVVLGREDHPPTGYDKTSIAFSFSEDKPGQLHGVLGEFAARNINLANVESRPSKESLGQYVFLIDLIGHRLDDEVRETLQRVGARTSMLKVFGSYPRHREEGTG